MNLSSDQIARFKLELLAGDCGAVGVIWGVEKSGGPLLRVPIVLKDSRLFDVHIMVALFLETAM